MSPIAHRDPLIARRAWSILILNPSSRVKMNQRKKPLRACPVAPTDGTGVLRGFAVQMSPQMCKCKERPPSQITMKKEKGVSRDAIRYLENAKGILKNVPAEENTYTDIKPVREAFGTGYLAVLEAINEVLLNKGMMKKDLPQSVNGYRAALRKYFAIYDGKLLREFEKLYDVLHIAGYYRVLIYDTQMVKDAMKAAEKFIEKMPTGGSMVDGK
jgi:hypothetical protein